jgi:hypothetical protein
MLRAFLKTMEINMTEKTLEALTDEEWELIKTIRENREDDDFRLLIERKRGIWEIELKSAKCPIWNAAQVSVSIRHGSI